jgi:hypothetical protein
LLMLRTPVPCFSLPLAQTDPQLIIVVLMVEVKTPTGLRRQFRNGSKFQELMIVYSLDFNRNALWGQMCGLAFSGPIHCHKVHRQPFGEVATFARHQRIDKALHLHHQHVWYPRPDDTPCHCLVPAWTQAEVYASGRFRTSSIASAHRETW